MSQQKKQVEQTAVQAQKPKPIQTPEAGVSEREPFANLTVPSASSLTDKPDPSLESLQQAQLLQMQSIHGNNYVQRRMQKGNSSPTIPRPPKLSYPVQTKMAVNEPDDAFEQEADEVAKNVVQMSAAGSPPADEEEMVQQKPIIPVQKADSGSDGTINTDVESRINSMKGGGDSLPDEAQSFFGSRMGADFSDVKIHTGSDAVQTSRDLNARAYTTENHIAFNQGEYQPNTDSGRELLAHELTHVMQQGGAVQTKTLQRQADTGTCPVCGKTGPAEEECPDCGSQFMPIQRKVDSASEEERVEEPQAEEVVQEADVEEEEATVEMVEPTAVATPETTDEAPIERELTAVAPTTEQPTLSAEPTEEAVPDVASPQTDPATSETPETNLTATETIDAETSQLQAESFPFSEEEQAETIQRKPATVQRGIIDSIQDKLAEILGKARELASGRTAEIESKATAEAGTVTAQGQTGAEQVAGEGQTKGADVASKSETEATTVETQSVSDSETIQGESDTQASVIEGEAETQTTAVQSQADQEQSELETEATNANSQLTEQAEGDVETVESDWVTLEGETTQYLSDVNQQASDTWTGVQTEANTVVATIEEGGQALEAETQQAIPEVEQQAKGIFGQLREEAIGILTEANPTSGQDLASLEGVKASIMDRAMAALGDLSHIVSPLIEGVQAGWDNLKALANSAWEGVKAFGSSLVSNLTGMVSSAWGGLKGTAQGAWQGLQGLANSVFSRLTGQASGAEDGVEGQKGSAVSAIQSLASGFLGQIGSVVSGLRSRASSALAGLRGQDQTAISSLQQQNNQSLTTLQTQSEQSVTMMKGRGDTAVTTLNTQTNKSLTTLQTRNTASQNNLETQSTGILGWLQNMGRRAITGIQNVWSGLKDRVDSVWSSITSRASQAWQTFQNGVSQAWQGLKNGWSTLKEMVGQAWQGIQNGLQNAKGWLSSLGETLRTDWLGFIGRANGLWGRARSTEAGEEWEDVKAEAQALSQDAVFFKTRGRGAETIGTAQQIQRKLGSGRPLDNSTRKRMEGVFNYNFSSVRVHTNTDAIQLSRQSNARAFAVGENIAFDSGEYNPGNPIGDALLAHELAHVVQQDGATISDPMTKGEDHDSPIEMDADRSAIGAVVSLWSNGKIKANDITQNAMPRLRTGLQLSRCRSCGSGSYDAPSNAQLASRAKAFAQDLCTEGCSITVTSGQRTSTDAHKWSTAYFIQQGEISIQDVKSSLTSNDGEYHDTDGNLWYVEGWTQEQFEENSWNLWDLGNLAFEGYEIGDPKRAPNITEIPVTRHIWGEAIDIDGFYDRDNGSYICDENMVKRLLSQHQLTQPLSCEPWHLERADYDNLSPDEMCIWMQR